MISFNSDRWNRYSDKDVMCEEFGGSDSGSEASDVDSRPPPKKFMKSKAQSKAPLAQATDPVLAKERKTMSKLGRAKRNEARIMHKRGAVPVTDKDTLHLETSSEDDCKDEIVDNINNLGQKSSNMIVCKFMKVATEKSLLLEGQLKPLAKELNLK